MQSSNGHIFIEKSGKYVKGKYSVTGGSVGMIEGKKIGEVCDHFDRASLSALFNTAEGNGKRQRQIRAKFFDDARGSATESAACLDALVAKGAVLEERVHEGKSMLVRIVGMLTKLIRMYSNESAFEEHGMEYREDSGGAE